MGKRKKREHHKTTNHDDHNNIDTLYEILGVKRTSSQQEIKKAYHRLALQLHPNKNPGNMLAEKIFEQLQLVMCILGDVEKHTIYDQTGADDAGHAMEAFQDLHDFVRIMHKKITEADAVEFEANYRGSDLEKNDMIDLYKKFNGDMHKLFSSMLFSDAKLDSHRFKKILDESIAAGELKQTRAYKCWAKQVSETEPLKCPSSRLKQYVQLLGVEQSKEQSPADMCTFLSQQTIEWKNRFESMCSSLVSKYGESKNKAVPSEEDYQAALARLQSRYAFKESKQKQPSLPPSQLRRSKRTSQIGGIHKGPELSEEEFQSVKARLKPCKASKETKKTKEGILQPS